LQWGSNRKVLSQKFSIGICDLKRRSPSTTLKAGFRLPALRDAHGTVAQDRISSWDELRRHHTRGIGKVAVPPCLKVRAGDFFVQELEASALDAKTILSRPGSYQGGWQRRWGSQTRALDPADQGPSAGTQDLAQPEGPGIVLKPRRFIAAVSREAGSASDRNQAEGRGIAAKFTVQVFDAPTWPSYNPHSSC
jgi:hypothetical protein